MKIPSRRTANPTRGHRPRRRLRGGAVLVEFAMIAPLLFGTVFASIEIGRALMATQSLEEAARAACRVAILLGAETDEVEAEVDRILVPAGVRAYTVEVQPGNLASAERWDPVTVSVTAQYADMTWLPLPRLFAGKSWTSSCTLPKEYSSLE